MILRSIRGPMLTRTLAVLSGLLLLQPGGTVAQDTVRISSEPSCPSCTLDVPAQPITLGGSDDPEFLGSIVPEVREGPDGRFYLLEWGTGDVVLAYDSTGALVGTVGRRGSGPGEFLDLAHLTTGPGDTLWVFDWRQGAIGFDETGRPVRQFRLRSSGEEAVRLETGDFVVAGAHRVPEGRGNPLLHVSPDGEQTKYFGVWDGELLDPDDVFAITRRIAASNGNRVWSTPLTEYAVEEWDVPGGMPVRLLLREAEWFPGGEAGTRTPDDPPHPRIDAIRFERASGLLWVAVQVPTDDWTPFPPGGAMNPTEQNRRFETIIEVIDVEAGRLLTSRRIPHNVRDWAGDRTFVTWREEGPGYRFVDVWRMELTGAGS